MIVRIQLSAADVAMARAWDRTVRARVSSRPNYTGQQDSDRFLVGYIGEIAVALLLQRAGVRYVHRVKLTGQSENAEFTVYLWDTPMALEVKTGAKPTHRFFLVSALQHDHTAPYFVGCRIESLSDDGADVSVMGWLERDKVLALPTREFRPGHPGYHMPYGDLPDMGELFDDLDKGEGRHEVQGDVLPDQAAATKATPAANARRLILAARLLEGLDEHDLEAIKRTLRQLGPEQRKSLQVLVDWVEDYERAEQPPEGAT